MRLQLFDFFLASFLICWVTGMYGFVLASLRYFFVGIALELLTECDANSDVSKVRYE